MLLAAAAAALMFWAAAAVALGMFDVHLDRCGLRLDRFPADLPPGRAWPKVSIVVPARDEEKDIEAALRSLASQDYPLLEVVAVDDRSGDRTGAIMDAVAAGEPRVSVVHVADLPAGWLGKNHANARGAERAAGDWLLFTDGDVVFAPHVLRRAIAFAERNGLGHVVALPRFRAEGYWEGAFVSIFGLLFALKCRLWDLQKPRTKAYIGSGTFNLVRRADYLRVGGHERIKLEVIDDVKLGLVLRRGGVPQGAVDSAGAVSVRWQPGFLATMRGMNKNTFAGLEWRWTAILSSTAMLAVVSVLPPALALWSGDADVRRLALAAAVLAAGLHAVAARRFTGSAGWEGLAHAPMTIAFIAVALRSAASATWNGGITWRGTRYGLAELKAGCVREDSLPLDGVRGWGPA